MTKKYDVVLSFASENREYVRAVAVTLQAAGIKVFYDEFEQANLWGKNLYVHLDEIYRNEAHFCVMFISKHYLIKTWTNHERESVQARAFQKKEEYILPARFDSTEIPGLIPTISYIDLQNLLPENFATIIIQKLKNKKLNTSILTKDNLKTPIIKDINQYKFRKKTILRRNQSLNNAKKSKQKTQTVNFTFEGISQLSNDKPIVYKVLTQGGRNNYTGVAKKGEVYITLQKHLQPGKNYVPGYKVKIERMSTIQEAQEKANRIIKISKPKYNK
ncbi:toll/interleukin-1 receptor domain-containing protein [Nostoc sp. ChiQUE01b]|uniref:toll/interleukin-1 receptor domain-containing protein n=1 Tax=Nostoc sp. ChiQUE01b TaxID=3075376 RepID=UPI002AD22926|nr:TIR domain-containing protein [Nostoc sp. ChiQUE01b]MDZ8260267.1 TIR domain-containing protein [Nostoc sp. ChiQUE01b]